MVHIGSDKGSKSPMKECTTWPIFIISLPDAEGRRSSLVETLKSAGLRYEIFQAVDARKGVPAKYENMIDLSGMKKRFGRLMSDPEIGCALSHQLIYKEVLDEALPGAVVFEDDAQLINNAEQFLQTGFYKQYDFVQLEHGFARIPRFGLTRRMESVGLDTVRLLRNSGMASAYALSAKASQFIVKNSLPLTLPADWPCDLRPLNPRITVPQLATSPKEIEGHSILMKERRRLKSFGRSSIYESQFNKNKRNPQSIVLAKLGWLYSATITNKQRMSLLQRFRISLTRKV